MVAASFPQKTLIMWCGRRKKTSSKEFHLPSFDDLGPELQHAAGNLVNVNGADDPPALQTPGALKEIRVVIGKRHNSRRPPTGTELIIP